MLRPLIMERPTTTALVITVTPHPVGYTTQHTVYINAPHGMDAGVVVEDDPFHLYPESPKFWASDADEIHVGKFDSLTEAVAAILAKLRTVQVQVQS
jgi:hypothetical protein